VVAKLQEIVSNTPGVAFASTQPLPSGNVDERTSGPIFLGVNGRRMDRYAADRIVKRLTKRAGITKRISPHSLRHSFITAALDAGVPLRDVQEAASHAPRCLTTAHANHSIVTPPTSSPRSWPEQHAPPDQTGPSGSPLIPPGTAGSAWVVRPLCQEQSVRAQARHRPNGAAISAKLCA
jgi:hypothetical protein